MVAKNSIFNRICRIKEMFRYLKIIETLDKRTFFSHTLPFQNTTYLENLEMAQCDGLSFSSNTLFKMVSIATNIHYMQKVSFYFSKIFNIPNIVLLCHLGLRNIKKPNANGTTKATGLISNPLIIAIHLLYYKRLHKLRRAVIRINLR